ncbi:MAG: hypothetical protein CM15mP74_04870 [Halieaceae bacterium]|nr:MAG: hypothetical protein CM15mP74_04870 [Halieaceae bacterium]
MLPIDATATITSRWRARPDLPAFNTQYDALRHDRKRPINAACPVLPGLAVLTSLGSRGFRRATGSGGVGGSALRRPAGGAALLAARH